MARVSFSLLCITVLCLVFSNTQANTGHPLKLEQECFPHLIEAASNSEPADYLLEDEYVTFLQSLCHDDSTIPNEMCTHILKLDSQQSAFANLQSFFIFTYNSLQCNYWCSVFYNGASNCQCSNQGIPIQGARPDEEIHMTERQYLYEVCEESYQALDTVLASYYPTPVPTPAPTPLPTYDPMNNPIVTATVPFGLANVMYPPMRAVDLAEDMGGVRSELESALEELTLEVLEKDILVEFGTSRRMLRRSSSSKENDIRYVVGEGSRRLEITFEQSYVTNIKDVGTIPVFETYRANDSNFILTMPCLCYRMSEYHQGPIRQHRYVTTHGWKSSSQGYQP